MTRIKVKTAQNHHRRQKTQKSGFKEGGVVTEERWRRKGGGVRMVDGGAGREERGRRRGKDSLRHWRKVTLKRSKSCSVYVCVCVCYVIHQGLIASEPAITRCYSLSTSLKLILTDHRGRL